MSFAMRTLGAHARWFTGLAVLNLAGCAPHHGGSGSGGEAGEGGNGGSAAGSGGSAAGSGGSSGSAGAPAGGSGSAGSAGSGSPATEPIVGCSVPAWPEEGLYFAGPFPDTGTPAQTRLNFFSPTSISANGRVVGGGTRDPESENPRPVPAVFTWAGGATLLPRLEGGLSNEGYAQRLSCDGSVALVYDLFGATLHRVDGESAPAIFSPTRLDTLGMDPDGAIVLDGAFNSELPGPRVWTAETGALYLPSLFGTELYHVSPDGSLIGSDFGVLFRYHRGTGVQQPIGMAPVGDAASIAFASSGSAWIQSADLNADSFLLWQLPAPPRSVTCPGRCSPIDVSSTGEVALLDVSSAGQGSVSFLWTKRRGFVDLATLFTQNGLDVGSGRKLRALGMSDDARVFTGRSLDPSVPGDQRFFYGVLPAAAYD